MNNYEPFTSQLCSGTGNNEELNLPILETNRQVFFLQRPISNASFMRGIEENIWLVAET